MSILLRLKVMLKNYLIAAQRVSSRPFKKKEMKAQIIQ